MTQTLTLADLGEDDLLARIFPLLPAISKADIGPGDDAAVLALDSGQVVASTDLMVQNRDFRLDWSSAIDIGWKAAAQNLADLSAMGASPTALLVGLVAPGTMAVQWVEDLARGLAAACAGTGAGVGGGDLSSGEHVVLAVTALGDMQGRRPVLRSGAQLGDTVAIAGRLGWSAAGLAVLRSGLKLEQVQQFLAAHRRPQPPYACGVLAAQGETVSAMLDISDGLVRDVGRIARASGVTIALDAKALTQRAKPLAGVARALGQDPLDWVLAGGEDHGLVATFVPGPLPEGFASVGRVVAPGPEPVLLGSHPPVLRGWDHFRS